MKFATLAAAFAATTAAAGSAIAGGYVAPVAEPVVVAPAPVMMPSMDWSGAYAGVTLGYDDADYDNDAGDVHISDEAANYGAFAGYNYDFGKWVVGGELEGIGSDLELNGAEADYIARAKAKVGYDAGKFLIYGTAGGAYAQLDRAGDKLIDTGYLYGVGLDYAVTDKVIVGAEVLQTEFDDFDGTGTDISSTSVGARVSMKF
ncbi:hypothetical protein AQS8620_02995 [Aquimixticola soesokkakensis]|uniref:Outer membrane protein beta-barrel domain-containing protein n=1 Tax=Aquimixticola soesokkakensis TaxID=1519096 RepID=A0A1Y5TIE2_9RHOB|nr:outer membrane beta-barrel protein [Aquimixticola soesokkakensis]SLN65026.1 hypothetical protein AQS8620_02995 [Aquimixticola soesokkakensis]